MKAGIMKTEVWKLKRYHMVWAGVFLMLLSVLLTVFSTTAQDGSVWTFSFFVEQVLKNNITTIFPMCIALITGYIISRENGRHTEKHSDRFPCRCPLCWLASWCLRAALLFFFFFYSWGSVSTVFTVMHPSSWAFLAVISRQFCRPGCRSRPNSCSSISCPAGHRHAARIPNGH